MVRQRTNGARCACAPRSRRERVADPGTVFACPAPTANRDRRRRRASTRRAPASAPPIRAGWRFRRRRPRRSTASSPSAATSAASARSGARADPASALLEAAHRAPSVGLMQPWRHDRRRGARDPHRDAPARPARAAAPGRSLRRARPPLPRPEDRGHRRGAARHLSSAATTATRTPRSSGAARSPRPTSTAPPARSRTSGSRRAPKGSASAG